MPIISHRLAGFVFAGALSLGLSQAGMAQAAGNTAIVQDNLSVYRAKEPVKPPATKPEAKGRAPSAGAIWTLGFWDLRGDPTTAPHAGWVWVPGRWVVPPVRGAHWDEAHWGWRDEWWSWIPGHWDEPRRRVG
jgi:hypothetical protein